MQDLVIFDGCCRLCDRVVQFILRHERAPELGFAPLQSSTGARMLRELGYDPDDARTFVLISGGRAYVRSDAAIELARYLAGGWRALRWLKIIPRPLRDWGYDVVARNRYRWFGRYDTCLVPGAETRKRFIMD